MFNKNPVVQGPVSYTSRTDVNRSEMRHEKYIVLDRAIILRLCIISHLLGDGRHTDGPPPSTDATTPPGLLGKHQMKQQMFAADEFDQRAKPDSELAAPRPSVRASKQHVSTAPCWTARNDATNRRFVDGRYRVGGPMSSYSMAPAAAAAAATHRRFVPELDRAAKASWSAARCRSID